MTHKQGSLYTIMKELLYPTQRLKQSKRFKRESSSPIERMTSWQRPSRIRNTQDEHEALDLLFLGGLGFPGTMKLIEANLDQRSGRWTGCRS